MIENNINKEDPNNKYNNLFVEDSDDNTEQGDLNHLFTSSESTELTNKNQTIKLKHVSVNTSSNKSKIPSSSRQINETILDATTGMDVFDNDVPEFIDDDQYKNIESISEDQESSIVSSMQPPNSPSGPKNIKQKREGISGIVESMLNQDDKNINGWDTDANITITNWYKTFKQQSFIYQFVLDKNKKMSDRLAIISIISSTLLGIFTGFKLWIDDDIVFQTVSNILLMLFNFLVALITATSKRYIDDKRNETIRAYIEEVDIFIGGLSAQVLNSPVYRMNADKFFKLNNANYTKLISSAPNLSINEINEGKRRFTLYKEHCYYNV